MKLYALSLLIMTYAQSLTAVHGLRLWSVYSQQPIPRAFLRPKWGSH